MNKFDKYLRKKAAEEPYEVPDAVEQKIEQMFEDLPERKNVPGKIRVLYRMGAAAACFLFITLFLMPNVSVAYAEVLEQIPVIGDIVQVVTIRNYFYSDRYHEMDIEVPKIEVEDSEAADFINKNVRELTDELMHRFYEEVEVVGDEGHGAIYVDYEMVTNTKYWFTLKLSVHEAAGSSNTYFKYYHINKRADAIVQLGDLAKDDSFYGILEEDVRRQMREQMERDSDIIYWLGNNEMGDCVFISGRHNFYWNENGDLVIVFDKYEVAPGFMGTLEFVIDKAIIREALKPEYRGIVEER